MRVLLDCDPGIDDTFALTYLTAAHHAGELELDCVTTTAGNVEAEQCAQNAAWVLAQCNLPAIPVAAGEPQPLELALTTTPETHGETGLGYAHAPARHVATDWDMLWCDAIERGTEDLHLIVTGPMTNLAVFARRHPRHFAQLRHITVMGGAVNYPGNTTPTAEWNFWVDPHAAQEVFARTPVPITLCSLGVTEQMLLDPPRLDRLVEALGETPIASALPEITRFYFEFHEDVGEGYRAQLHDLLTVLSRSVASTLPPPRPPLTSKPQASSCAAPSPPTCAACGSASPTRAWSPRRTFPALGRLSTPRSPSTHDSPQEMSSSRRGITSRRRNSWYTFAVCFAEVT